MISVAILVILCIIFFAIWIKGESFLGAAFVTVILGALAGEFLGFDFKAAKAKLQEFDGQKLEELVEAGDRKIAEIDEAIAEFDRVHGAPGSCEDGETGNCVKDNNPGFKISINVNSTPPEPEREEVRVIDVLRELNLEPKHIVDYIREVAYAKLYKEGESYELVTPEHGTFEPDVFLMHSDGRLFVGKDRRVWPVGAD